MNNTFCSEKGATLVETALTLPVLLFGIFLVLWIATSRNEQASFDAALGSAMRLASTRGDPFLFSKSGLSTSVSGIDTWITTGNATAAVQNLLSRNIPWTESLDNLDQRGLGAFASIAPDFKSLPSQYIYAFVYIFESMQLGVGNSIRYSCNPDDPGNDGCLECRLLSPDGALDPSQNPIPYLDYCTSVGGCPNCPDAAHCALPTDVIALQCKYRPKLFLLSPILGMLRILTGQDLAVNFVMRRTRIFQYANGTTI